MKGRILCLLSVVMSVAQAQLAIKPGDAIIRADLINSSHHFYKAIETDSSGTILYEWVNDEVITIDRAAGQIIFARSRQVPVGNYFTDTSFTDMVFRPVRMHEMRPRQDIDILESYNPLQADVHIINKGGVSDKTYSMKSGYFEDNMIEYVYGYLDLQKEMIYTLDNFRRGTPSGSDPVTIEYVFDDIWTLDTGIRLNCRVLHFVHGANTGYIWIDKKTRDMIKELENIKGNVFSLTKI